MRAVRKQDNRRKLDVSKLQDIRVLFLRSKAEEIHYLPKMRKQTVLARVREAISQTVSIKIILTKRPLLLRSLNVRKGAKP